MEWKLLTVLSLFTVFLDGRRSFVDTASLKHELEKTGDEVVTELESLKNYLGKELENEKNELNELSVSKSKTSLFVNNNGQKSSFQKLKNKVEQNGKLVAEVQQKINTISDKNGEPKSISKTEVEIPSKGIYDVIINKDEKEKEEEVEIKDKAINKISNKVGREYGPLDMAEYIYWTGDEKNVALMIEELLEEGFMSRQEAINFLQSIKFNLDFMQARDKNLQKMKKNIAYVVKKNSFESQQSSPVHNKNEREDKIKNLAKFKTLKNSGIFENDENFDENLNKLKAAGVLYKEYSLEEIIYQLAKIMFSQSLTVKNADAQKSLHKLVAFLEKEVKKGQISRNLERKLLDVLIAALTDTFLEEPDSIAFKKEDVFSYVNPDSPTLETIRQLPQPDSETLGVSKSKEELMTKTSTEEEKSTRGFSKKLE